MLEYRYVRKHIAMILVFVLLIFTIVPSNIFMGAIEANAEYELEAYINNFDPDVFTGGYSMGGDSNKIEYTVQAGQGVTGSAISLAYTRTGSWGPVYHANIPASWDLTGTQSIIMHVKGDGTPVNMYIGVEEDEGGDQFRKLISISGTAWNQIAVPVSRLEYQQNGDGILDWDKVDSINISVETNGTGTVLIDDFMFYKSGTLPEYEPEEPDGPEYSMPVILQNFNNDDTGNWSLIKADGASISAAAADPGKSGKAIRFDFVNESWGTGASRSTGTNYDWSRFTGVSFWAKGQVGQQFKFKFEEDANHLDEWAKTVTLNSNDWEQVNIQFTDEFEKTNAWKGDPLQDESIDLGNIINYGFIPMGDAGSFAIDEIILTSPVAGCTISDVSTDVLGSVFTGGQIALSVGISNFGADEVQKNIGYEVKDIDGAVIYQNEKLSAPIGGLSEGTEVINFTVEKYGYYTVDVYLLNDQGEKGTVISKPFVYMKPGDNNLTRTAEAGVGYSTHYDYLNENQINMEAQLIRLSGANLVRQDFLWDMIEPEKGNFDWSFYDKVVSINYANNLDTIGLLCYSAPWSSTAPSDAPAGDIVNHYPPADPGDYAEYVYRTVSRYQDRVHYWELWNEPNLNGFFRPTNSPESYYELLKAGYLAAKRADPDAKVVMAGLSGTGSAYMQELLNLGAADYTDALVIHPYQAGDPEAGNSFLNDILSTRQKAPDKDIWITEWGWQTKEHDLKKQAVYTAKGYVLALAAGVENIALYSFNQATDAEYGLVNASTGGMVKPVYAAVNALNGALAGREYTGGVNVADGVKAYCFTKSGELPLLALWSSTDRTIEITGGSDAVLYDMYGNPHVIAAENGKLTVNVNNEPQYLIGNFKSIIQNAVPEFVKTEAGKSIPMKSWQMKSPYYSRANPSVTRGEDGKLDVEIYNYQNKTIKGLLKIEGLPKEWFGSGLDIYRTYAVEPYSSQIVSFEMHPPENTAAGVYNAGIKDFSAAGNLKELSCDINVEASLSVDVNKNSIELTNNVSKEITGNVVFDTLAGWTVNCPENSFALQPGESVQVSYSLTPAPQTPANGEVMLSGSIAAGDETIPFSQKLFVFAAEGGSINTIDGLRDSEWDGAVPITLNRADQVSMDYVTYSGPGDLSADVYAKWDSQYLYLLAEVKDDIHMQPSSGGAMWQGDSIQAAFDSSNNGEGDYPWGNELQIGKNVSGVDEFNKAIAGSLAVIKRDDAAKTTVYEMKIPFDAIEGISGIAQGKAIGFSMLINDNDGSSREGYMEWSSGIGAAKSAELFGTLFLK